MLNPACCSVLEFSITTCYLVLSALNEGSTGGLLIVLPYFPLLGFDLIVYFMGLSYDPPVEDVDIFFDPTAPFLPLLIA